MNDTLKSIMGRYSCRDYTGAPPTAEQIKAISDAALAAPSAMNRQPWQVIVISDKALMDEMDKEGMRLLAEAEDQTAYERMMSRGGKLFYNAPCMVLVAATDDSRGVALDCGILSQNVALAAYSLGLGSCIVGMASTPLSGPKGDEFRARVKFPEGYAFGMGILFGEAKTSGKPHEPQPGKLTSV